ncbi:hypothetical protein [Methanosaeta sp. UBA356]|uniref:hypothetical protein n=1 Tax=Methanosaeta sp. UBA356 TaxID=1915559 RepID=UPI00257CC4F5|nr:hypothetical protein [Methanosaeta sp. UBA356]
MLRIFEAEGQCIATFAWGCCSFPAELREELEPLVGHDIAVLRLGKYHFQVVD